MSTGEVCIKQIQPACIRPSAGAMCIATMIGKYQLGKTIGEGTFAKVKIAVNMQTGQQVAVKIIHKQMIMENKLMHQVTREIETMKLLHHPNIVRIHEVLATKTKIYLIMDYIAGGRLSDKIAYLKRLTEGEARKYFQQLIDAVDYCHLRGVCHRDLKPENLLLDWKGDLKVSDFGLSVLKKPNTLLSTSCGSPGYIAPEVIAGKRYDGIAADVWSCGVVLYELLAGYLPFDDSNILNVYRKISKAEYACPRWFTAGPRRVIFKILDPNASRRMTVAEVMQDEWFKTDYEPSEGKTEDVIKLDDVDAAFGTVMKDSNDQSKKQSNFINAFQLIAMSNDLDLSGLFKEKNDENCKRRFGSKYTMSETIEKIEAAANNVQLSVKRMNQSKIKLHEPKKMTKSRSYFTLAAEVIEVTPAYCMVEISKSTGDVMEYTEFCRSLSTALIDKPGCSIADATNPIRQRMRIERQQR
ncbi:CBL-interacting serine/threonine-protein kinase 21 [Nymphaea thermarum]|nr:CBL-interacting serine/threonine-protein kinase 21 [Nymphaea thermarum]